MIAEVPILYCAWCKKITVDSPANGDVVVILFTEFRRAYVNGIPTYMADGICDHCRATKFSEFPKKVTNDLATK